MEDKYKLLFHCLSRAFPENPAACCGDEERNKSFLRGLIPRRKVRDLLTLIISAIFILTFQCSYIYSEEELELITYYPAPFMETNTIRALYLRDIFYPNEYFLDLDSRSFIFGLDVGLTPSQIGTNANIQVGGALDMPNTKAGIYAEIALGGTYSSSVDSIAVYGLVHGDGDKKCIYGSADGASVQNIGVMGRADDIGIVGITNRYLYRNAIIGTFGRETQTAGGEGAVIGLAQDIVIDGVTYKGHGVMGKTSSSDRYGGYFKGDENSDGIRVESATGHAVVGIASRGYGGYFKGYRGGIYLNSNMNNQSIYDVIDYTESPIDITCEDYNLIMSTTDQDESTIGEGKISVPNSSIIMAQTYKWDGSNDVLGPYIGLKYYVPTSGAPGPKIPYYTTEISSSGKIRIEPDEVNMNGIIDKRLIVMGNVYIHKPAISYPGQILHEYPGDIAEPFELSERGLELGDVVVIDEDGKLEKCKTENDPNVAGIISSEEQALMTIGKCSDGTSDRPLALAGKVLCKVSVDNGQIMPGDLLSASSTPGYAMKARPILESNGRKIYKPGTILGMALESLKEGEGKILVQVRLR